MSTELIEIDLGVLQPKQGDAFDSHATEILYGGAAGGGKSHLLRIAAIYWCHVIPGLQVYLFRRTFPDLWKNHMEGPTAFPALLAGMVLAKRASINYSNNSISFSNGSKIFLCHCQYEKDIYSYQGAEIHVLMIDELTHFTEKMYVFLRGRVRIGGFKIPEPFSDCFPRIVCGSNPGGIGHNWVKASWIDIAASGVVTQMPPADGGMRRQFIQALLEDNPILMENDPEYESKLEGLGDKSLIKALRRGIWDIVSGGAVDDIWNREAHVVAPFRVPPSWRVDRSMDWGSSKPFSIGWWAESDGSKVETDDGRTILVPRGTLFRIGEWYGCGLNQTTKQLKPNTGLYMNSTDIGRGIAEREGILMSYQNQVRRIAPGPADASMFVPGDEATKETNDSIYEKILEGYRRARVRFHGDLFYEANKSPGSRKIGLDLLRTRLMAVFHKPKMETPGIFIFDTCTDGFLRTVPVLPRDSVNPDDVDSDAEDHAYDETRYRLISKPKRTEWSLEGVGSDIRDPGDISR